MVHLHGSFKLNHLSKSIIWSRGTKCSHTKIPHLIVLVSITCFFLSDPTALALFVCCSKHWPAPSSLLCLVSFPAPARPAASASAWSFTAAASVCSRFVFHPTAHTVVLLLAPICISWMNFWMCSFFYSACLLASRRKACIRSLCWPWRCCRSSAAEKTWMPKCLRSFSAT